jgi:hypothetical protein
MIINKEEILEKLEESINRLEGTLTSSTLASDSDEIGLKGDNLDPSDDVTENIEVAEAALMVAEGRIEQMIQVLSEEIDSLRTLMERIEEEME